MWRIALKMLIGDRAKYLGLIFGITFATLLMSQQVSIFVGLMARTSNQIRAVTEADFWVMHPLVQYFDEVIAMPDRDLSRVRGVEGVKWAVPFFKGLAQARPQAGLLQQVVVIGVDDATLIGKPSRMVMGKWEDIRLPNAMIIDRDGYFFIWPNQPFELGRVIEVNDRRMVIVGICETLPPFLTFPIMFTKYSDAINISPGERNKMTFIIGQKKDGEDVNAVTARITEQTGLQALSAHDFVWRSIDHYLKRTGIPINFGITVVLGFMIGAAIAGQTFYIFVIENLKQFGALKAIGVTNIQILKMVLLQALMVGVMGYGIGLGLATLFFEATSSQPALRGFYLPWQIAAGTAAAVTLIVIIASLASIRKVFVLDPAIVFRG